MEETFAGRGGPHSGLALFTDLYELTMLQAYFEEGLSEDAVFSLFVRRLPERRNYLLACGLDSVLDYLENLRFEQEDIAYLATLGRFSGRFLDWLCDFRFSGEVRAVPEGTPVFANEPIVEIAAPLPQAQLVETLVMNQIQVQTLLASKARRVVEAAAGRSVVDFGARRMHGIDAALKAARAFYVAGVASTSNVLAGRLYTLPVAGTMAHSYIQAHEREADAFKAFARLYPDTVLLVDTYDTLEGVQKVVELSREMGAEFKVRALRLDSGDLLALSRETRRILDEAGLSGIGIFASGGLDEESIAALLAAGAPIDGFGVGTSMGVSQDAPDLDVAYKLCEYGGRGRVKLSSGKPVLPGRKQVFRCGRGGEDLRDVIAREGEEAPGGPLDARPLLEPVMQGGRRLPAGRVELEEARRHAQEQIARLPARLRALAPADPPYRVDVSPALARFQDEVEASVAP
ncbi:nicotinate phosphoribosyltransferase [Desulfovibrio sp. X2]|uniref:nicotinate phosphoribosyltransferase n=1 Tax=Desulfovibrio sp. X2 TaxID=941449 RepID=UPI000358EA21|nr:nicotinate phosphoribosyltransferase [Desulfovibrio sp. X2]EPR37201.1 nicotinate phosphoribosyltransferase [Desulfovibrio sp. X2]